MKKYLAFIFILTALFSVQEAVARNKEDIQPRIVNIINFIRATEPRIDWITEDVLYETVESQFQIMNRYGLKGTFLLQYDALVIPRYQQLLKKNMGKGFEIGGWWEITQPHVEAAGLKWRGRYPWDWRANVGFATGYTPKEREKLVDVYMQKFKEIFGAYPKSVGSWFIDAHTLAYMHDRYGIIASCNCKDQIGTDGYTLWGGYWNQAYYPSRVNAYMPAQTAKGQIPVPIFRMLGSDPIYQYESGIGGVRQHVVSLEPVYSKGGGNEKWVRWFFNSMFKDPTLNFSYVQAGQENSFTWKKMGPGFEIQMPLLKELSDKKTIRIETLAESGTWFRKNYRTTPPTAVSALEDSRDEGRKTVWFNSRYYRANMLWHNHSFRIRDIHLFDENIPSDYISQPGTSTSCIYYTLPFVDGCLWSSENYLAGLGIKYRDKNGKIHDLQGNTPEIKGSKDELTVIWPTVDGNDSFLLFFQEDRMEISCSSPIGTGEWFMELTTEKNVPLPFTDISTKKISAAYKGNSYHITPVKGHFEKGCSADPHSILRIIPENNRICINFK